MADIDLLDLSYWQKGAWQGLKAFKIGCYIEIILPKWQPAISSALLSPLPLTLTLRMKENILLIGCDIASQQLITDELKQAGYQINTSANRTEFEQFLAKSHPDLILLNYPIHSS